MTVRPLDGAALAPPFVADAPASPDSQADSPGIGGNGFARALDALGAVFGSADAAEDAFAAGRGSLQDAMYDRARAGVVLNVAVAAAQRCTQAAQAILNMQV